MTFAAGAFASVTCVEVLEHIEDIEGAVREIARLARERVFVTVPDISAIPLLEPHFARVRMVRIGRNVKIGTEVRATDFQRRSVPSGGTVERQAEKRGRRGGGAATTPEAETASV